MTSNEQFIWSSQQVKRVKSWFIFHGYKGGRSRHLKRKRGRNAESSPGTASECSSKIMFTPLVVWKAGGGMNNWETSLGRQLS